MTRKKRITYRNFHNCGIHYIGLKFLVKPIFCNMLLLRETIITHTDNRRDGIFCMSQHFIADCLQYLTIKTDIDAAEVINS